MLSKFSVKKPFTVFVMVVLIIVLGVVSFMRMTPELFPNINMPYVVVMTVYPGAAPEEVEGKVTAPLEEQMATLENIKNIQSISAENYSMIILEFEQSANLDVVSVDIRDKMELTGIDFGNTIQKPIIFKMNPNIIPTTIAAVNVDGMTTEELSTYVEEELKIQLEGINGVASVTTSGLVTSTINVTLDPEKIQELNDELNGIIAGQVGAAKGQISSGITAAQSGMSQIGAGKEQIEAAQAELAVSKEVIGKTLEAIQSLVIQRDTYLAMGNAYGAQAIQATIDATKATLESYSAQLATLGIDLNSVDASTEAAAQAVSAFNIAMTITSDQLSNQMAELSATSAYLNSTIMQLNTTLAQIDAQAPGGMDLTSILSVANISQIISANNFSMPAGYVTEDGEDVVVSVGDKFTDIDQIESLVLMDLGIEGMDPITVGDVATVEYLNDGDAVYAKINGENGILLSFQKQSDVPTAEVSDNILAKFASLEKNNEGLHFAILSDQGEYIDLIIAGVLRNLLIGAILAILILLLFLKDWKPTLIIAISIPTSVTFAVILMYFSGVTLNMISLSGLAVGVGMLVDNSIVVIENIYRLRQLGYSKIQAAVNGARQMSGAITASTLTTVCVFLPIIFTEGVTREIFTDLALTITYSLLASLFIALTVVPAVGSKLLEKVSERTMLSKGSKSLGAYKRVVDFALGHRALCLILAVGLLFGSFAVELTRGFEFMPGMATEQISATIVTPEDATPEEIMDMLDEIGEETKAIEGVETVGIMPASSTAAVIGMSAEINWSQISMYVLLEPEYLDKSPDISKQIAEIGEAKGCEMFVSGEQDMSSMSGTSSVRINIFCNDIDTLILTVGNIEEQLRELDCLTEVSDVHENVSKEVAISVDKNAAMEKGLTVAQVYMAVSAALSDNTTATSIVYDGGSKDVIISSGIDTEDIERSELEDMEITAATQTGAVTVRLGDIAEINDSETLSSVSRLNQRSGLSITANLAEGYNATIAQTDIEAVIDSMDLPDGVSVEYSGSYEEIMDAMADMLKMMALGILFIYLIMVAQFQSFVMPFIVMFTVPLAFTGGALALLFTGNPISVVSMIGYIVLMGIIVNNGIVLVDCINSLRRDGIPKKEAIRQACTMRIRPVLMTAITTILGLVPLAIGIGDGSDMVAPVAIVCIGGLIYATLTTLVIIPVVYDLITREKMTVISDDELTMIEA